MNPNTDIDVEDHLRERITIALEQTDEALDWDGLKAAINFDDDEVDEAIKQLQKEGELRYHGRRGGYVRVDGPGLTE